ncbi:MAG: peptidoglycan DD-metalloendopeptidase family protein [Rhodospirillaceae bacterium]|nr:peptidoglycan DD-metalloendopeptidase family protein [Rhodospirillaceae bacterium]MBT5192881.1 peptidoglycan DD-metalloendopeptidase family protein [Rhodospirillaceae bacterium]MBT5895062.1 peptidoglycan DD-metalloendopeptidase family protein [Rhodospirillaceae bacterium]MBT6429554.1 peptidoglycan DD-metalloendopeptidase family protein [Rhodospirillaceae bacterium]
MNEGIAAVVARLMGRLYPERQIILRSRGEVSFVTLGQTSQIGLSLVALSLLGWLAYASVGIYLQLNIIADKDVNIARMVGAHDRLNADMRAVETKYRKITANLESNQKFLGDVLRQRASLDRVRTELLRELGQTQKQRDLALNRSQKLQDRLTSLETSLRRTLNESNNLQSDLSQVTDQLASTKFEREQEQKESQTLALNLDSMREHVLGLKSDRQTLQSDLSSVTNRLVSTLSERDRVQMERKALATNLNIMRDNLSGLRKARRDLRQNLQSSEQMVARLTDQRNHAVSTSNALNRRIASLEDRLEQLHISQRTLVGNIHDRTDANISELESVVQITGLNLDKMVQRVNRTQTAVGGPLLDRGLDRGLDTGDERQTVGELGLLETRLTRWSALNAVLERLPITPPVDSFSISSRFGKRRDPFTKRRAFHGGVDLAGVRRTRVRVTSPGVVTFVGWKGPYGRMVEVDHGLGIRTRYGHLQKILVKRGQKVEFRQKIGLMGSSGRSTGSHVHYEILFDRKPLDPMKFLKAGKYVFKG